MNQGMTTCEYDGSEKSFECAKYEQCDECFLVDHLKECDWCEHYDHPSRKLSVSSESVETHFEAVVQDTEAVMAEIAEQEYKWGDERASNE
jgi:hypothetical protein